MVQSHLVLLVDALDRLPRSASVRDVEAAAWAGFEVYHIEPDFTRCETAEAALDHVPKGPARPAAWVGYIPSSER